MSEGLCRGADSRWSTTSWLRAAGSCRRRLKAWSVKCQLCCLTGMRRRSWALTMGLREASEGMTVY